jgi:hypothetical protein
MGYLIVHLLPELDALETYAPGADANAGGRADAAGAAGANWELGEAWTQTYELSEAAAGGGAQAMINQPDLIWRMNRRAWTRTRGQIMTAVRAADEKAR